MEGKSDAEARREARRRRILQNSDDRLRKIKGEIGVETQSRIDDSELNGSISGSLPRKFSPLPANESKQEDAETKHLPSEPERSSATIAEEPRKSPPLEVQQPSLFSKLCQTRVHIALLAILVRLLLLNDLGFLFGDMVLIPLLVVQLTSLLLPGPQGTLAAGGGLLGAALVLSGLTQSTTHSLLHTFCWLRSTGTDLALYLFTFFLTHAVLQLD